MAKLVSHDDAQYITEDVAELYVSNITPPFWDYVRMKYLGFPSVKDWAVLDKLTHNAIAQNDDDMIDDHHHDDHGHIAITNRQIQQFLDSLSVDQYLRTVYDPNELEIPVMSQQELEIANDKFYKQFNDYSTAELKRQLDVLASNKDVSDPGELIEALTIQQRIKKALKMRAKSAQLATKRHIALSHRATQDVLKNRARKLAIRMFKKLLANGREPTTLSYADRARIEKIISRRQNTVDQLERRMLPIVRKIEDKRFKSRQKEDD